MSQPLSLPRPCPAAATGGMYSVTKQRWLQQPAGLAHASRISGETLHKSSRSAALPHKDGAGICTAAAGGAIGVICITPDF